MKNLKFFPKTFSSFVFLHTNEMCVNFSNQVSIRSQKLQDSPWVCLGCLCFLLSLYEQCERRKPSTSAYILNHLNQFESKNYQETSSENPWYVLVSKRKNILNSGGVKNVTWQHRHNQFTSWRLADKNVCTKNLRQTSSTVCFYSEAISHKMFVQNFPMFVLKK